MLDLPEQGHANLFRHAARGDVFGVNQRAEALQAQMVEPVVATGQCSLRCEPLAPQVAAHQQNPYPAFGTLALDDPLSDNSHGYNWAMGVESARSCVFTGGAYHVNALQNYITPYCWASPNFSNFVYQVQLMIVKGDGGGIIFRVDNDYTKGDFYLFGIGQNGQYGLYIYKNYTSVSTLSSGPSTAINTGLNQSNLLTVVANGSNIDLYVNNHQIDGVSDSTYSQGHIGVFAGDLNGPTEVVFSNAKVWT
jgi:eukaryotic-like serine/threonine-protein kinase